jgi:HD-like signal output (HDOD) protein
MKLEKFTKMLFMSTNASGRKIASWIQDSDNLPQKPSHFLKLMRFANSVEPANQEFVKELVKNRDLVAKILNLPSISASVGHIEEQDIENAVKELEKSFIQTSLEVDMARKYGQALSGLNLSDITEWRLSVKTAVIAKTIAVWMAYPDLEIAFGVGLLHKLPSLLMKLKDLEAAVRIEEAMQRGAKEREAEVIVHGFDHCEFGTKLFKYFALPEAMIDLMQNDFCPEQVKSKFKNLAQIVNFAEFVAASFNDKTQSPSSVWAKAQPYIRALKLNISVEEWANKISVLFVKSLEFEMTVLS